MPPDKTFQVQRAALGAGMLFAVAELALDAFDATQGAAPSRVIFHGLTALALLLVCAWLWRAQHARGAKTPPPVRLDLPVEQLRALLDNIPDRIWMKDAEGRFILMNRAEADVYGTEPGALIGKTCVEINMAPADVERVASEDRQVMESGRPLHLERESHVSGGWLDLRKLPFKAADGSVGGLLCIARDLTEARRSAAMQARLAALSGHRAIAMFERTLDNEIVSWSTGAEAMLGYSAANIIGKSATFTFPPDMRPEVTSRVTQNNERLAQGVSIAYEGRRLTADGRVIDVLISQAPITDAAGKLQGASVIFQDITELKRAQTRAADGEERYRSLFESCPMPVVLWNQASGLINDINAAAVRVFGFVDDEFMGLPLTELANRGTDESRAAINAVAAGREIGVTQDLTLVNRQGDTLHLEMVSALNTVHGAGDCISVFNDVGESRRAANTMREARGFLLQVLDSYPDMIAVSDSDRRVMFVNKRAAEFIGMPDVECLAMLNGGGDGETYRLARQLFDCAQVLTHGARMDEEVVTPNAGGAGHWYEVNRVPLINGQGVAGALVLVSDVTARRLAERRVVESESRLRTIIDNVPMLIGHVDATERMTFANKAYEDWFGIRLECVPGMAVRDMAGERGYARIAEDVQAALSGVRVERERTLEVFQQERQQESQQERQPERFVKVTYVPDVGVDGVGRGYFVFAYDLTGQRRANEALASERNLLRSVLNAIPDQVFAKDGDGRYFLMNRLSTGGRRDGDDEEDTSNYIGLRDADFQMNDLALLYESEDAGVMHGEVILNKESQHDMPWGREWWMTTKVPLCNDVGEIMGILGVSRNVTQLKQSADTIQRLNTELEQRVLERTAQLTVVNRELEAFASSVSHDLRAPLRGIDGFSLMLLEEFSADLPERARDYLQRVRVASRRMGEQIEGMLALSRVARSEVHVMPVDLSALGEEIVRELRMEHVDPPADIRIAPGLRAVGDPRLLRIALENLLRNAVKFSGKRAHACVEFCADISEGDAVYCVRDNGVGFDMAYADKLFGAFQRLHTEREFPGTGVGLATVQRVIHRHGGRVWAQGAVGQGAAFYFTLNIPTAIDATA